MVGGEGCVCETWYHFGTFNPTNEYTISFQIGVCLVVFLPNIYTLLGVLYSSGKKDSLTISIYFLMLLSLLCESALFNWL